MVRLATAGKPARPCLVSKPKATGRPFSSSRVSLFDPTLTDRSKVDSFGLFTGQIGYAWNAALLYVKGGAAVTSNHFDQFNALGVVNFSIHNALGWHRGRRVGVRLRSKLVGRC